MPLYGGIDLHANNSVIVLLNEQDQVIYQRRLANHLSEILEPLAPYQADITGVVVESTYNWYSLVGPFVTTGGGDCLKTGPEACWQVDTFSGHLTGTQPPQNNMITSV